MDRSNLIDVSLFVLRLALGIVFVAHGLQKVFGIVGGPGIEGVIGMMKSLGFMPPVFWAWVVAVGELGGGTMLVLGVLPRLSAAVIAVIMTMAVVQVHGKSGYFASNGGFEYPLLILMVALAIILAGGGKISLFNKL
jgi:putative oxidoreductase